jgi:hypothetical protein
MGMAIVFSWPSCLSCPYAGKSIKGTYERETEKSAESCAARCGIGNAIFAGD